MIAKRKWVENCQVRYLELLLSNAKLYDRGQHLTERGLKALYHLGQRHGFNTYIPTKQIRVTAGISPNQGPTAGLWDWLLAGIVEKDPHRRAYRFRGEFHDAVKRSLPSWSVHPLPIPPAP